MSEILEPLFRQVLAKYVISYLSHDKTYLLGLIIKEDYLKEDAVQIHFTGDNLESILKEVISSS